MSAAAMQSTPAIPPRPARSQDKGNSSSMPSIPPRPAKRFNRSVSPNPDRFAPSPLNESPFPVKSPRHSQSHLGESIERSTSVGMPNVGEEGQEYAAAMEDLSSSPESNRNRAGSPEQTRTVGEDLKLHAPKPTMPASSAKQRVAAVTRTDSDRAAAFGIGRPSSEDQLHSASRSLKKKASTTSQLSHHSESMEDEQGIPEIGQRVPMLAYAGDVQAPSPAPPRAASTDSSVGGRNHARKLSSRGFGDLPPGSYGLHGHGVSSTDKLEKAYYEKHPELRQKEHYNPLHDRVQDYSMSSQDLNKLVNGSRGAGFGTSAAYTGTPSEQVGYQATEEYTARVSRPPSTAPIKSPLKSDFSGPEAAVDDPTVTDDDGGVIHVDDTDYHKAYAKYGDMESGEGDVDAEGYSHPILASDEVAKYPTMYEQQPAVPPSRERHGSTHEMEEPRSRPSSRPASITSPSPADVRSTPLENVEEYEPLFPEDEKTGSRPMTQAEKLRKRFPSRDIWEDAPNSVHSTAEVMTPEPTGGRSNQQASVVDIPPRDMETPAQAFARRQEELAEKEAVNPDSFLYRTQKPPNWAAQESQRPKEVPARPKSSNRFPSRDVWEDTPDSLNYTTTVSTPQTAEELHADDVPDSPVDASNAAKPSVPARPAKKQGSGDSVNSKPAVPGRPKPSIPARPTKATSDDKDTDVSAAKAKPAVPSRPVGGKIAALQAGFMSDLNNRLRLGPQAPKKEEPPAEENAAEEKEKAPLSDARKGRARGPQRRAPTAKSSGASASQAPLSASSKPTLSFSMTRILFSIDEEGTMTVDDNVSEKKEPEGKVIAISEPDSADEAPKSLEPEETKTEEAEESKPAEPAKSGADGDDSVTTTKTLATNMAGESILQETIEEKESGEEVKKVDNAKDEVIS